MTADSTTRSLGSVLRKLLVSNHMASWLGQGLVSAINFVVLIVLARFAGIAEVGYYAVGFSILVLATSTQDALVTKPYAVQIFNTPVSPGAHAYGALTFGLALAFGLGLGLATASALLRGVMADPRLADLFLVLAVVTPPVLARDFARRFSFANLLMRQALALDVVASAILLGLLGGLAWQGLMNADTVLAATGVAGALSAVGWLSINRASFKRENGAARQTARQSWFFGKWLLASQICMQVQGYATHWITLIVAGATITGLYSASLSIVSLANPFLFGLFNVLTPKYVRALKNEGEAGLRRAAFGDALLVGAIMGAFTLFLLAAGGPLMAMLFPNEDLAAGRSVLPLLAAASAIGALGAPATLALSAAERGRAIAGLSFVISVLGSVVVWLLLLRWNLLGAVIGIVLTEIFGTAARWVLFLFGSRVNGRHKA